MKGTSNLIVLLFTVRDPIIDAIPRHKAMFAILLPTTLDIETPGTFFTDAITDTTNSGTLVPNATSERPMNILDTPKVVAKDIAPETKKSAPFTRNVMPRTSRIKDITIAPPF